MVASLIIFGAVAAAVILLVAAYMLFLSPALAAGGAPAPKTVPANVTGLSLQSAGVTSLGINFTPAAGATSYQAQVRSGTSPVVGTGTFVPQSSVLSGKIITITGLTASTFYDVKILSVNSVGSSSGTVLLSSAAAPLETLATPTATAPVSGTSAINLASAANYVMLSKSGISNVPNASTKITGAMGISPAAASFITGFSLVEDSSNTFWTSVLVTGDIFAADNAAPTPGTLTTAINDMQAAYVATAGNTNYTATEYAGGILGGLTLTAGVYKWSTNVGIDSNLTLAGSATDVWIFEIAQNLELAAAQSIILTGGALAKNVIWQVGGNVTLSSNSIFNGTVLCLTNIAMQTGATLTGRLYAQTAITLDSNTIVST